MEEVENGECYEYDEEGHAMCNGAKRKYIRFFLVLRQFSLVFSDSVPKDTEKVPL